MTPAPSPKHQEVLGNLYAVLREHVGGRGPGTVFFAPIDVILSDRRTKLQLYARHGVPHYWAVGPEARLVETYELAEGAYRPGARVNGDEPLTAPPFLDLAISASALRG